MIRLTLATSRGLTMSASIAAWVVGGIAVALMVGWAWLFPTFAVKDTLLGALLIFIGGIICADAGWVPVGVVYALAGLALLMWGKR